MTKIVRLQSEPYKNFSIRAALSLFSISLEWQKATEMKLKSKESYNGAKKEKDRPHSIVTHFTTNVHL